jgi:hypothetical protein
VRGAVRPGKRERKLRRVENLDEAATSAAKKARKLRQRARHHHKAAGATAKLAAKGQEGEALGPHAAVLKDVVGRVAAGP